MDKAEALAYENETSAELVMQIFPDPFSAAALEALNKRVVQRLLKLLCGMQA